MIQTLFQIKINSFFKQNKSVLHLVESVVLIWNYLVIQVNNNWFMINSMEQSPFWDATVTQLVKNFPVFYRTRRFITLFTTARHWSLSWSRWIESIHSHPISQRSIL